jgi:hypothetical protein
MNREYNVHCLEEAGDVTEQMKTLAETLGSFDAAGQPLSEYGVLEVLQKLARDCQEGDLPRELQMEILAFALREERPDQVSEWGTRYGPTLTWTSETNETKEWPDRNEITPDGIAYWTRRAQEASHPVLKARYAGAAWDLARLAGVRPDYRMAQAAIDAAVHLTHGNYRAHETEVIRQLEHALRLARTLGDEDREHAVRDAMIQYEEGIAVDEKAGLWGFSFDNLVLGQLGSPTEVQATAIVEDMEARISRLAEPAQGRPDPWKTEAAAARLAEYYRRIGNRDALRCVLAKLVAAFEAASESARPMLAHAWMEHLYGVLSSYGLPNEAGRIAVKLAELGPAVRASMKEVAVEFQIDGKKLKDAVDAILGNRLEEALGRIAAGFVPELAKVEAGVRERAQKAPLAYLFPMALKDQLGRTIARVGTAEIDPEGRMVHEASQNLYFLSPLLRDAVRAVAAKYSPTADDLVGYLYGSPAFRDGQKTLLRHGLKLYLDEDWIAATHVLVPQVESAFRTLLGKAGRPVMKSARQGGGFDYRPLDDLLRDPAIEGIFGQDATFYLRALLTDRRGWNARNSLCHGILPATDVGYALADRLFHVLLCLAQVREKSG